MADESGPAKKKLSPEWQPVRSDRRVFAISHPAHYDIAAEHAWILPLVPLCFTLETLDWLVAVAHELCVSIDERPQQSRLLM